MRAILLMLTMLSAQNSIAQIQANDCIEAITVCNKETIVIESISNLENDPNEIGETSCYHKSFPETNSVWLTWEVETEGTLEFSLIPVSNEDDLDFVLYKVPSHGACESKEEIRCMTSGENIGEVNQENNCLGVTGIRMSAEDYNEPHGCSSLDDNFLKGLYAYEGEVYLLVINNLYSTDGFLVEFFGSAQLDKENCQNTTSTYNEFDNGISIGEVYPNPSRTNVMVDISVPENAKGHFQIFNTEGRLLNESDYNLSQGEQTIPFDISSFSTGVYFLKVRIGEKYYVASFSKQ